MKKIFIEFQSAPCVESVPGVTPDIERDGQVLM